jgi:hypothetical protein
MFLVSLGAAAGGGGGVAERRNVTLRRLPPSRCGIATVAGLAPGWFRVAGGAAVAVVAGGDGCPRRACSGSAHLCGSDVDDLMLVTPYLYRLHGYQHPLLHLKRLGPAGIFESYAQQFEAIWAEAKPIPASSGGPRVEAR